VRWRDAKQYCNERSLLEGFKPCYNEKTADWDCDYSANGYRLPTEAEWEYAARAGTEGPYDFGPADKLRLFRLVCWNADQKTHVTGQKRPNRWGLYDIYGNVSEWCEDVYSPELTTRKVLRSIRRARQIPGKDVKTRNPGRELEVQRRAVSGERSGGRTHGRQRCLFFHRLLWISLCAAAVCRGVAGVRGVEAQISVRASMR